MRSSPLRAALLSLFVASMALPGQARQSLRQATVPGPVKNAGTYHVATGEWSRTSQAYGILTSDVLYRNDLAASYFALFDEDEIVHDEGRLPGADEPLLFGQPETGTSDVYRITGFQFGYCAMTSHPTTYSLAFREAYEPCKNPANYPILTSFRTTGLPSNGCWVVAFDLEGTTLVFDMAADGADGSWDNDNDLDDFGFSVNLDHGQGNGTGQLVAGPFLAGRCGWWPTYGAGTVFKNPTLGGTGLGTEDLYWITSPLVADGCYFYQCGTPGANLNMVLFGEGREVSSYCSPGNGNSVSMGGAVLASVGGFGTAAASFAVTDTPNQPGVLFTGPDRIQTPFGCGSRCVGGGGLLRYGPYSPVGNTANATIDMTASSNGNIQWWYRDPAHAGVCGAPFNLSNALGM